MNHKIKAFRQRFKDLFVKSFYYSPQFAIADFLWWMNFYLRSDKSWRRSSKYLSTKTNFLERFIEKKYPEIIIKYNNQDCSSNFPDSGKKDFYIWVFWNTGIDNMPPIVKACHNQLCKNNDNVTLISLDNYREYVSIDDAILNKVIRGKLGWANFSDILRTKLLRKYGGLWVDATVWVPKQVPFDFLNNLDFFSPNGTVEQTSRSIKFWTSDKYNWSTWCMWSKNPDNILFSFVAEMMEAVARDERVWPDYVFQDFLIDYAVRHFPSVEESMRQCNKHNCPKRLKFMELINSKYDEQSYNEIISNEFAFKLSSRTEYKFYTDKDEATYYNHFISESLH